MYHFFLTEKYEINITYAGSFEMPGKKKEEIITFKVDEELAHAMKGIDNRSAFIRNAVSAALQSTCPLCRGTGILTPEQRNHWREFSRHHSVEKCTICHAFHLVCNAENGRY